MARPRNWEKGQDRNFSGPDRGKGQAFPNPHSVGSVVKWTVDAASANIVAAIRKAGQEPMPFCEYIGGPACVSFIVDQPELRKVEASVEIFAKTMQACLASTVMRVWAESTTPHRSNVLVSPAEYKDHHVAEIVFPDGTKSCIVYWPGIAWLHKYNPAPPLQVSVGGPDAAVLRHLYAR